MTRVVRKIRNGRYGSEAAAIRGSAGEFTEYDNWWRDAPVVRRRLVKAAKKRSGHGGAREGAGRKPTENARTTLLQLKVSAEAMARVQARALAAGRSVADWVRREIGAE